MYTDAELKMNGNLNAFFKRIKQTSNEGNPWKAWKKIKKRYSPK